MLKTVDVPAYLRDFNSLFALFAYKHEISRVFDDFLTIVICCLARQTQEPWYLETIRKYNKDQLNQLAKAMATLFIIYDNSTRHNDWIDPLGDYYQALASNHKKSGFGQFFTPKALCDVMAMFVVDADEFGKTVNDCAAGSGRTLLAANKIAKGHYYYAEDLDHVCVKMCCINLAMHGMRGEVRHMNSLTQEGPFNHYVINYDWFKTETPFIYKL